MSQSPESEARQLTKMLRELKQSQGNSEMLRLEWDEADRIVRELERLAELEAKTK